MPSSAFTANINSIVALFDSETGSAGKDSELCFRTIGGEERLTGVSCLARICFTGNWRSFVTVKAAIVLIIIVVPKTFIIGFIAETDHYFEGIYLVITIDQ